MGLAKAVRGLKDATIGSVARTWLNTQYLHGIGKITALRVDTADRRVDGEIELRGEDGPIRVRLAYALVKAGKGTTVSLRSFDSSRAWLNEAVGRFVVEPGIAFPLPKAVADAAERVGV
jgi:hypothetical protein